MFLQFVATVGIKGSYNTFKEAFLCIFTKKKKSLVLLKLNKELLEISVVLKSWAFNLWCIDFLIWTMICFYLFGNWFRFYSVIINITPVGNTCRFTVDTSDWEALQNYVFLNLAKFHVPREASAILGGVGCCWQSAVSKAVIVFWGVFLSSLVVYLAENSFDLFL